MALAQAVQNADGFGLFHFVPTTSPPPLAVANIGYGLSDANGVECCCPEGGGEVGECCDQFGLEFNDLGTVQITVNNWQIARLTGWANTGTNEPPNPGCEASCDIHTSGVPPQGAVTRVVEYSPFVNWTAVFEFEECTLDGGPFGNQEAVRYRYEGEVAGINENALKSEDCDCDGDVRFAVRCATLQPSQVNMHADLYKSGGEFTWIVRVDLFSPPAAPTGGVCDAQGNFPWCGGTLSQLHNSGWIDPTTGQPGSTNLETVPNADDTLVHQTDTGCVTVLDAPIHSACRSVRNMVFAPSNMLCP